MNFYLIEFEHDSKKLGFNGFDHLLVCANSFEEACQKIHEYALPMENPATGYQFTERYLCPRNFRDKTIR